MAGIPRETGKGAILSASPLPSALDLLQQFVSCAGPPGQEEAVRVSLRRHLDALGRQHRTDAKGNLLVGSCNPRVVVTAHLDEIALMVSNLEDDGTLRVAPLGGAYPFKLGEGPVEILPVGKEPIPAAISFGATHTSLSISPIQQHRDSQAVTWPMARVLTGHSKNELIGCGVRPGTRVVLARSRRQLWPMGGDLIAGYFLDDRAALVAWLLILEALHEKADEILFAATSSEEVGGEGALYLLASLPKPPDVCLALEIAPVAPDARLPLDANPAVWSSDAYSNADPSDLEQLAELGRTLGFEVGFQVLSRGGSDASCAAARGLCARPLTLAFPTESSHGFEVIHRNAITNLAALTTAYLRTCRS